MRHMSFTRTREFVENNQILMRIIHLSDLNVGYKDCGNKFRAIIDSISLKMYPAQDFVVVITGNR